MAVILAIDPGASGALAFFNPETGMLDVEDMPTLEVKRGNKMKREISPQMLAGIIASRKPDRAIIELVGAMPGQGVTSMFAFGKSYGLCIGICAGLQIPVEHVTPHKWKKAVGAREGKDGNRMRAAECFPAYAHLFRRVKDDGRADAALIAFWAATQ
jgi:crossover junction endodeoxyribonuclease RuvC